MYEIEEIMMHMAVPKAAMGMEDSLFHKLRHDNVIMPNQMVADEYAARFSVIKVGYRM